MNLEEILKLEYKYSIGAMHKLQELHKNGKLNFPRSGKSFNDDLAKAISQKIDIAICFLFYCQKEIKNLEKFYEDCYNVSAGGEKQFVKLAYILIRQTTDPANFFLALKKVVQNKLRAEKENTI